MAFSWFFADMCRTAKCLGHIMVSVPCSASLFWCSWYKRGFFLCLYLMSHFFPFLRFLLVNLMLKQFLRIVQAWSNVPEHRMLWYALQSKCECWICLVQA
jgi:hypothetical protein